MFVMGEVDDDDADRVHEPSSGVAPTRGELKLVSQEAEECRLLRRCLCE